MRQALTLALRGAGSVSPNPCVGAVITDGSGRVLGEGFHKEAGGPHAEIIALAALPDAVSARGATLYVTMEPCSTQGRTGPCTSAILESGISRVVVGSVDPNPAHSGRGLEFLQREGITVLSGVLAGPCTDLNRAFNKWIVTGLPWVVLKSAVSLDGRTTRRGSGGQWITGSEARAHVHRMRALTDAILVGSGTVLADNPRLTARDVEVFRQPLRVVLQGDRELPSSCHLLSDEARDRTLIFRKMSIGAVLSDLGRREVTRVILEGGPSVHTAALREGCVDEVSIYVAPMLLGASEGPMLAGPLGGEVHIASLTSTSLGPDLLLEGRVSPRSD